MLTVSRRDMVNDMLSLQDVMNHLVSNSFVRPSQLTQGERNFVPALDLSESEDAYFVEATVPGYKAENLDITVENNVLYISGEVKQDAETNGRTYHHRERVHSRFQRSISLPNSVQADAIKASLNDGILHLEIPKAEEVKPRRISVNVGEKQLAG